MIRTILERQNPWWKDRGYKTDYFSRSILKELKVNLNNEFILGLVGSRQVGKTALLHLLIAELLKKTAQLNILYFNADDLSVRELFNDTGKFLEFIGVKQVKKYVFIDEIQRLQNPGLFLKTIYDMKLPLKMIVSGSSQLEMKSKLKEFLVGRMRQFEIPRLGFDEIKQVTAYNTQSNLLHEYMLYGSYPAVVKESSHQGKQLILRDIYQSYIEKDISDFSKIENIEAFNNLLILLSAQIGGLLNVHTLAKTLRLSAHIVSQYLDILEGTFIIKRLYPFYRNYKKEISKTPKVYFLDLGLRNYILGNWQEIALRSDKGSLFENMVFLEFYNQDIYKLHRYHFWRTTNQTEIDFVIEDGEKINAYEAKYAGGSAPKSFHTFKNYYPESSCQVVDRDSFDFVGKITRRQ